MRDLNFLFVEFQCFLFFITSNFPLHIESITVFIYISIVGCRKSDIRLSSCSYSNAGKRLTLESVDEKSDMRLYEFKIQPQDDLLQTLEGQCNKRLSFTCDAREIVQCEILEFMYFTRVILLVLNAWYLSRAPHQLFLSVYIEIKNSQNNVLFFIGRMKIA